MIDERIRLRENWNMCMGNLAQRNRKEEAGKYCFRTRFRNKDEKRLPLNAKGFLAILALRKSNSTPIK